MNYKEITDYWSKNLCSGGNPKFPFCWWKDKKVLEIGCGAGMDAYRFIMAKAKYTGIDLTQTAVEYARTQIGVYGSIYSMNAEFMEFPEETFDLVYSFGVIHHAIYPQNVINEAYRVLKNKGHICIMLYNKLSFRYLIEIMFLRKILWWLHYPKYAELRKQNPHPTKEQWISWNTDTLGCPLSRVYTKKDIKILLNKFIITNTWTENWGWFRIIIGRKEK